ncbi:hypothetical protein GCM10008967_21080 [Bacillus carboniphilus]|uniref:Sulfurtransferase n=1 Tax=Bacillus carboniphilus TaxID=86663 RepID=A0ABN0WAF5_9BACI
MKILLILVVTIMLLSLYKRYVPILGVKCLPMKDSNDPGCYIVDVRDYNQSYKSPVKGATNIPIAYLKRYWHELKQKDIYVVASTPLEKNMSIRFLKRRGFNVQGFMLTDCNCRDKHQTA